MPSFSPFSYNKKMHWGRCQFSLHSRVFFYFKMTQTEKSRAGKGFHKKWLALKVAQRCKKSRRKPRVSCAKFCATLYENDIFFAKQYFMSSFVIKPKDIFKVEKALFIPLRLMSRICTLFSG